MNTYECSYCNKMFRVLEDIKQPNTEICNICIEVINKSMSSSHFEYVDEDDYTL